MTAYEPPLNAPTGGYPMATMHTNTEHRAAAESTLRDTLHNELGDQAGQIDLRVSGGLAGRVIVEAAREAHAQLIVLASKTGKAVVPGTVTHHVLLKAPCAVMVVPTGAGDAGEQQPATR